MIEGRRVTNGLAIAGVVLLVGGCVAANPPTFPSLPTFPVPPEVLPTPALEGSTVTCGDRTFPASGMDAPTGAETGSSAEAAALRQTIATLGFETSTPSAGGWRLGGEDSAGAIFVAEFPGDLQADQLPGWNYAEISHDGSGWHPDRMGLCEMHVVLPSDYGPAEWAFDSKSPQVEAADVELHILVWERACSGGSPATGRISPPVIFYGQQSLTITLGVSPIKIGPGMGLACPGPPGTPAVVQLREPVGHREILDGWHIPTGRPVSPFGEPGLGE